MHKNINKNSALKKLSTVIRFEKSIFCPGRNLFVRNVPVKTESGRREKIKEQKHKMRGTEGKEEEMRNGRVGKHPLCQGEVGKADRRIS